jgi:DNA mismatch repair ATPase MutS
VFFDYVIKDGPSKTKNAIKLLDSMGYDARIVSDAEDMVKTFEKTQSWE